MCWRSGIELIGSYQKGLVGEGEGGMGRWWRMVEIVVGGAVELRGGMEEGCWVARDSGVSEEVVRARERCCQGRSVYVEVVR